MPEDNVLVKLEHGRKSFGDVAVLKDISLEVRKGEVVAIIGPSGGGKSTLLRCMTLLETLDAGSLSYGDLPVAEDNGAGHAVYGGKDVMKRAKSRFGLVFQNFNLFPHYSVIKNVTDAPISVQKRPRAEAFERGRELLAKMGLADKEDMVPCELSGGQQQRVAIARALAMDPEVLLCDEATSALDPNTTRSILSLLQEINRTMGVTIVVITHEMKVVEQICNKVAVLDGGVVAESGLVKDIFVSPQSAIARELILPKQSAVSEIHGTCVIRIVFDGQSAFEPVISNLSLECHAAVNILGADTKNIDGKAYGQMLLQLPEDEAAAARIRKYLESRGIVYEDIEYQEAGREAEDDE